MERVGRHDALSVNVGRELGSWHSKRRLDSHVGWGPLQEFSLDVIDDIYSEAAEIAGHGNGWLTYFPALHRFREAGAAPRVFDMLDEHR